VNNSGTKKANIMK